VSRPDRPELPDVVRAWIELHDQDMHTCLIARVQSYDAAKQTADLVPVVQHAVEQPDGSATYEPLPVLPAVPVAQPRNGPWFIALPITPGTYCVVHVLDASTEHWRAGDAAEQVPGDLRRRTLGSCVAYPVNFYPRSDALAHAQGEGGDLVIGHDDGTRIRIKPSGEITFTQGDTVVFQVNPDGTVQLGANAGTNFVALANLVQSALDSIFTWATTHTHSGVTTGPGSSGVAAPVLGALGPVAATKAKAL
jgi:hypothetical protein